MLDEKLTSDRMTFILRLLREKRRGGKGGEEGLLRGRCLNNVLVISCDTSRGLHFVGEKTCDYGQERVSSGWGVVAYFA